MEKKMEAKKEEKVLQHVRKIVSLLKRISPVDSDSDLIPELLDWEEAYKTRKEIVQEEIRELEELAKDSTKEIVASFNFCESSEDREWSAIFLAEVIAKKAKEEMLPEVINLYLSDHISSHSVDAFHDGLLRQGKAIITPLTNLIKEKIKMKNGEEGNELLQLLSRIRSNEALAILKDLLNDANARTLLPDEDFLNAFLNQGKGIEAIRNSDIMESSPEKADEVIQKLENDRYPREEEFYRLPRIEAKGESPARILEGVWGYEATAMDACVGCGKETKSHMLPKGEVMCHNCWSEGKGQERLRSLFSKKQKEIEETMDEVEIQKSIYQEITELSIESGEFTEAEALYDKILEKYPEDFTLLAGYGELLHKMGKEKEKEIYKRMTHIRPYDSTAYKKLGTFYAEKEAYEDAIANFTKALELNVEEKSAFPEEASLDTIVDDANALKRVVEKRFPEKYPKEEKTKGIREVGLLEEEKKLFEPSAEMEKKPIEALTEKLLAIRTLRRKLKLGKKREEDRLDEGVEALKERDFLATLETLISQYPPTQVIDQLETVSMELEKEGLEGYLIKLLASSTIPKAIPIQYAFLNFERFGEWADSLINVLSEQGEEAIKFLEIELKEGRVPLESLLPVWNVLTDKDQGKAVQALLSFIELRKIKPSELSEFEWDFLLRDLTRISDEKVRAVYERLQEKIKGNEPANAIVERYYAQWKQKYESG